LFVLWLRNIGFVDDHQVDVGAAHDRLHQPRDAQPVVVQDVEVDVRRQPLHAPLERTMHYSAGPVHQRLEDVVLPDALQRRER
jgi:hypothetical protein